MILTSYFILELSISAHNFQKDMFCKGQKAVIINDSREFVIIYYKFISEVIYICSAFGLDKDSFLLIKIDILFYMQLFIGTYNLFFLSTPDCQNYENTKRDSVKN